MNTEYITLPGDRFDLIAMKAYGTIGNMTTDDGTVVNAISLIINNNPDITVNDILDAGLVIQVPVIINSANQLANNSLPPWKQS